MIYYDQEFYLIVQLIHLLEESAYVEFYSSLQAFFRVLSYRTLHELFSMSFIILIRCILISILCILLLHMDSLEIVSFLKTALILLFH